VITDMSQTLGWSVGNALEIAESLAFLAGDAREPRLAEVVFTLSAEMLVMGAVAGSHAEARKRVESAVQSGEAAERFARMVAELGGPADLLTQASRYLPKAPLVQPVFASEEGYVAGVDARAVGNVLVELGGGRKVAGQTLDLAVGLTEVAGIGTRVGKERPLAMVHARSAEQVRQASAALRSAVTLSEQPRSPPPIVHEILGKI
jgi:thymidine phosphorylase